MTKVDFSDIGRYYCDFEEFKFYFLNIITDYVVPAWYPNDLTQNVKIITFILLNRETNLCASKLAWG